MSKYTVILAAAVDDIGTHTLDVEAQSVIANADWIFFHSGPGGNADSVVAAFPKDRVISVTR
jgi:hypothetical protein